MSIRLRLLMKTLHYEDSIRVPAYKEFGMMTSQSLFKQHLMCRQVSQQISINYCLRRVPIPQRRGKHLHRKQPRFATKYRNPASLNSFTQNSNYSPLRKSPSIIRLRIAHVQPTAVPSVGKRSDQCQRDAERIRNAVNTKSERASCVYVFIKYHESFPIVCRFLTMSIRP